MFRSSLSSQFERDMKVGAAGELFVFELLSSLRPALVGFTHDNWQSTIRKYVDVHPEYSGMLPWTGRETSDITYDDRTSVLTNTHNNKEKHTQPDKRQRRNLKYYIEVKSTFGSCDTPFFMSDNQNHKVIGNPHDLKHPSVLLTLKPDERTHHRPVHLYNLPRIQYEE